MASPDKKKRKHKKAKRSSRTPTRSSSYSSNNESRYQSSHKRRKSKKAAAHSPSRERSRSPRSKRKKSEEKRAPSPSSLYPQMPPGAAFSMMPGTLRLKSTPLPHHQSGFPITMSMSGMPNLPSMAGMPAMFPQKIPVSLPQYTFQSKVPNKRIIRPPRTQFKARLYVPYTFDIAMVTANDRTLKVHKEVLALMIKNVLAQMERRAKDQKQDENVMRKIQQLGEDVQSYYSTKRKVLLMLINNFTPPLQGTPREAN